MATREEITILISYVLGEENRQLLIEQGLGGIPKESRIRALRALQDLGWINHGGYADFGESYSLTKEGRRMISNRPSTADLESGARAHIESLRQLDSGSACARKDALRKLIDTECEMGNWDSALIYCFELKAAADGTSDADASAYACYCQGRVEMAQNRWDEALESYLTALEKFMETGDRKGVCDTNRAMGTIYGRKGDHASATRCFEASIAMAEEIGDRDAEAKAQGNLAIIYDLEGRFEESERAHRQCLEYFLETGNMTSAAVTANNLGVLNMSRERFQMAAEYFDKTISSGRSLKNKHMIGTALVNAGYCYARTGDTARALEYTDESVRIFKEPCDLNMLALAYRNYGRIEMRGLKVRDAFEWFEKSVRAAKASGVDDTMAACCYEYGMSLIEAATDLRLAKKLLKRASVTYRKLGNAERAGIVDSRAAAV